MCIPLTGNIPNSRALIGVEKPEDRRMDAKKSSDIRQRLSREYENLIKSINRNRMAAEEIKLENTEDEADRATISHNKELLYNLHESDFMRLRVIQEALNVLDRGQYGQCSRCWRIRSSRWKLSSL